MGYTLIEKNKKIKGWHKNDKTMLRISKQNILLTSCFIRTFGEFRFIKFYKNDDGYLCFKKMEERDKSTFLVSKNNKRAYYVRCPRILNGTLKSGKYTITLKDGYYVSNCKLIENESEM